MSLCHALRDISGWLDIELLYKMALKSITRYLIRLLKAFHVSLLSKFDLLFHYVAQ